MVKKGFLRLIVLVALIATLGLVASPASTPVSAGEGPWELISGQFWDYRQEITIDHNRVGTMSALTDDAAADATKVDVEDYSLFTGGETVRLVDDLHSEELMVKGRTGSNTVTFWSKLTNSYTVDNHACLKNVSSPGDPLINFPVLVKISDQTNDIFVLGNTQPEGEDILFTDVDGTKLSHEIDYYYSDSGTKELDAWVKVPSLSASEDTILYMYYGNPDYFLSPEEVREEVENVWEEITTISDCENTDGWTAEGGKLSLDRNGKDGKCVKDTVDPGDSSGVTTYNPDGTWDLSNERIDFWLQSDRASTDYNSAKLYAYETDTKYCYWDLTFDADTWTHIVAKGTVYDGRSKGPAPDLSSTDYISLDFEAADTTGFYKMIDWIRTKSGAVMVQHLQESSPEGAYILGVTYDDHFDSTSNHNDGDVFADNVVHGQTVNITAQGEAVPLDFKLINEYPEPVIYTYGEPGAGKWTYTYYDEYCTIDCENGTITANVGMDPGKDYLMNYTYSSLGNNTGAEMSAEGKIAGADFFDGDDDFIDFSKDDTNFDIRDAITVEAWVNVGWRANKGPWEADNPDYGIVSSGTGYEMCLWTDVAGNLTGVAEFIPDGWFQIAGTQYDCCPEMASQLPLIVHEDEWYRIAIVCDGTDMYTYVNSVLEFSLPADVPGLIDGELGDDLFVGISGDLFEQVLGTIDEVRISDVARDAAWIKACYYNQAYPDVFCSLPLAPPTLMEGDVDLSQHVDMLDAMFTLQYAVDPDGSRGVLKLPFGADQLECADTYDDGIVDIADAMHILQYAVDPDGSRGVLKVPLWDPDKDAHMLQPVP